MERIFNHPEYGMVKIRTAMLEDNNHTDLHDGVEIKFLEEDDFPIIEKFGHLDLDEITSEEVIEMIDDHISFTEQF